MGRKNYSWTKEECIIAVNKFYRENNRTPRSTEFKNRFGLPSRDTMEKLFETNNITCMFEQCGLIRTKPKNRSEGTVDWEWEIKKTTTRVKRYCDYCKKEYSVTKSQYDSGTKCCSRECYNEWQKTEKNRGKNNPNFTSEYIKCDYCGKYYIEKQSKIKKQENHLCSKKCRKNWFAEVYTQTKEWKRERAIIAVNSLENNNVNKVNTEPQIKILSILDELNVNYKCEKGFKYYSIDIYLLDYDIPIEIMGTYWHCDFRKYKEIKYETQVERIIKDKAKNTYIKNNHGLNILYLWEEDINNNIDLCKSLINEYINISKLENYHSFNYSFKDGELNINNDIEIPYMEMDSKYIKSITDIKVIEKRSMKQEDKWITFKCEVCGKEKEQLISHYNKNKHHFCSKECVHEYNHVKNTEEVTCSNCGKTFRKKKCDIKRSKTKIFCCSRKCRTEYDNIGGMLTNCHTCGKEIYVKPSKVNNSKTHHCSLSCASKYGLSVRNSMKFERKKKYED